MLELNEGLFGVRSQPFTRLVERGAASKFAHALGVSDALYYSREAAQAKGYREQLVPPTYAITLLPFAVPGLRLPAAGVIHGEQSFHWHDVLAVGDEIHVTGWVQGVKSRAGTHGRMHIITIASEGWETQRGPIFTAESILIVTEANPS